MTRVAVLGASGFGRFHAREFHRAGARVASILGSTPESAAATSRRLLSDFGCEPEPFHDLDALLATAPDVVSVCTPHAVHFEHACAGLAAGAHVLCEKPLFWRDGLTPADSAAMLARLAELGARERLGLSTANVHFIDELARRERLPRRPRAIAFRFFTQGPFQGAEIGVDLLPHALSILGRLLPGGHPQDVRRSWDGGRAAFEFDWGGVACSLDLREDPGGRKLLAWSLDDREFQRGSSASEGPYRVYLTEAGVAEPYEVEDPLQTLVRGFLLFATGLREPSVDFAAASSIQSAMLTLLT